MRIEVEGLTYKGLLAWPDMVFESGVIHFIVGESGCGKSTLLKLLNHTLSPDTGQVRAAGKPLTEWDPLVIRRQIALVSQEAWLFPGTILDNFKEVYSLRALPLPAETELETYCRLCRVDFPLHQDTAGFSGGERHRLFMALFLSLNPQVLMLDEPTAALDEASARQVLSNITDYCKQHGMTALIVTHDRELESLFSENTVELRRGGR